VGVTWYTFLEQGRPIKMSADALQRVGDALRLGPDEIRHLFLLADRPPPSPPQDERVPDSVAVLLEGLVESPTWLVNPRYDIVGWNRPASVVWMDLDTVNAADRNLVWLMMTAPGPRVRHADWEGDAQRLIAALRARLGENHEDDRFSEIVQRLLDGSPEFRAWWPRGDVAYARSVAMEMHHPRVGALRFSATTVRPEAALGFRLLIWSPDPTTATRQRVRTLLAPL
jgi:hypothetical protein